MATATLQSVDAPNDDDEVISWTIYEFLILYCVFCTVVNTMLSIL